MACADDHRIFPLAGDLRVGPAAADPLGTPTAQDHGIHPAASDRDFAALVANPDKIGAVGDFGVIRAVEHLVKVVGRAYAGAFSLDKNFRNHKPVNRTGIWPSQNETGLFTPLKPFFRFISPPN